MVRIWAKVMFEDKIVKDYIYEKDEKFDHKHFFVYVSEICEAMDVCTPVILNKHINHFMEFNNSIFLPTDFPEAVTFDRFTLEEANLD